MELKYSLKKNDIPVVIEGEAGEQNYRLVEMTAALRDQYLDTMGARMHMVNGMPAGIKKFDGMQADLLTRCLVKEETGKCVTVTEVQNWPASLVAQLFEEAQKINHLNREEADKEKKV